MLRKCLLILYKTEHTLYLVLGPIVFLWTISVIVFCNTANWVDLPGNQTHWMMFSTGFAIGGVILHPLWWRELKDLWRETEEELFGNE